MGLNVLHAEVAGEGSAARVIHVLSLAFSSSSRLESGTLCSVANCTFVCVCTS